MCILLGTNVNKDAKITAAVASNIWSAYEKGGRMAFNNEDMQFMFMECEEGKVRIIQGQPSVEETGGYWPSR